MKNKGFTLIELIGTIVILSLSLILIVPAITNSLKKGVKDADKKSEESIILAAKNYVSDNKDATCVNLSVLQSGGYIDKNIKLPSTSTDINNVSVKIDKTVTSSGKTKYSYTYQNINC